MAFSAKVPDNAIFDIKNGDIVHYICQSGVELTEETFDGQMNAPLPVGSAKPGTHGTYVLLGDERAICCLGEGDIIKDFYFDEDEWEWAEGQLAESSIVAAPDTNIAAVSVDHAEIQVFFLGSSGVIQSLSTTKDGILTPSHTLPHTTPSAGASLCAIKIKSVIHVFYAHKDLSIHDLALENGKWNDTKVPHTDKLPPPLKSSPTDTHSDNLSPKSHIEAFVEGTGYSLQFWDADEIIWVLEDDIVAAVGRMTNGGFRTIDDAQGHKAGPRPRPTPKTVRYSRRG